MVTLASSCECGQHADCVGLVAVCDEMDALLRAPGCLLLLKIANGLKH